MSQHRDEAFLLDIAAAAQDVIDFTAGTTEERFRDDAKSQAAVLYKITIIGEAVKRLSEEFRASHPEIPWKLIAGMRNRLIHEYDRVKVSTVWLAVKKDVPAVVSG